MHVSELFDGQCHQHSDEDSALLASQEVKTHLKNWALIGSAIRNEMPAQLDLNFADKVMAKVEQEELPQASDVSWVPPFEQEQAWVPPFEQEKDELPSILQNSDAFKSQLKSVEQTYVENKSAVVTKSAQTNAFKSFFTMKRLGIMVSQIAIAASVAAVAVVGLQTYNASDFTVENVATTASTSVGPVSGLNLASFQNGERDVLLNVDQLPNAEKQGSEQLQADLKRQQEEELEKINTYVQGFVLDTANNQ